MILLTPEELVRLASEYKSEGLYQYALKERTAIAKAQLRKVVEWGEEDCPHRKQFVDIPYPKRTCSICWSGLRKVAGL